MKRVFALLMAGVLLPGCSKLPTTGDGIVAIEIHVPAKLTLYKDSSIVLVARALDQQGNEVAGVVRWYSVDTAAVTVDSMLGKVTARVSSGSARIQATVGTLHSSPLTLILAPTPTTSLIVPQDK